MDPYKIALRTIEDINMFSVHTTKHVFDDKPHHSIISISKKNFNDLATQCGILYDEHLGPPHGEMYMQLINKMTDQRRIFKFDHTDEYHNKDVWRYINDTDTHEDQITLNILY